MMGKGSAVTFHASFALYVDGRTVPCVVAVARTFVQRARGLLWRRPLSSSEALWIHKCDSIHTVGMGYAIDVVFLSRDAVVLRVSEAVAPWRFRWCRTAQSVLELPAGQARRLGISPGCLIGDKPFSK
ncbi:MAG: DUF192 domain-containing protein [Comamonas sp.]|jgi:uncharacterized membrane protein (UPF0127 family)|uniref:DUF192 domain-containing protein n=1 Tax=Comamonas sp. TaxID=34028 RepID=UPI00282CBF8C|nr:DUF192 domain-containing protein [Comamonas sp.]MDR0215475.1 DUF192 domain-containing protein [Comamonas sp.]